MPAVVTSKKQIERTENAIASASTLSEMQAAFQRAIMLGDDAVLNELLDNSRTGRSVLFGVYRHAYVARLVEVVRNDHPLLSSHLGDDTFREIARAYVAACPSHTQNARWFSDRLPDHLAEAHPDKPHLAELAALERALNDAFDAPDREPLALSDLAAIPAENWSDLVFEPHPSARRLAFTSNAHALWLALKNGEPPPPVETAAVPENILVWRHETTPKVRRMSNEEAMMWNEASNGVPFGKLCELVAVYDDPETAPMRAARHLQGWIQAGLLAKPVSEH
ncbi:MAG TPA: DNA-binding domain-containing protein [Hyphomicrobium sp.]|nr:DNA-binding domain-containing protein [Hyphomicrobium sp.]